MKMSDGVELADFLALAWLKGRKAHCAGDI